MLHLEKNVLTLYFLRIILLWTISPRSKKWWSCMRQETMNITLLYFAISFPFGYGNCIKISGTHNHFLCSLYMYKTHVKGKYIIFLILSTTRFRCKSRSINYTVCLIANKAKYLFFIFHFEYIPITALLEHIF